MAKKAFITTSFPEKTVPESKKDESYHRSAVNAIMGHSLSARYPHIRERILLAKEYFNGTQQDNEFDYITSGGVAQGQGEERTMPAKWINFQDIRNRVKLLVGELIKRGFEVDVQAINREAKSKKLEFKKRAVARIRMKDIYDELEGITGIPLGKENDEVPWEIEELERFMNSSYKSTEERIIQTALEYNLELYKWKYKRLQQFRDILIGGMCFAINEIRNGYPQIRTIAPETAVWDYNATDDFLTDSQFFGEVEYMTAEDVIERYNVAHEDLEELYQDYVNQRKDYLWRGLNTDQGNSTLFQPFSDHNGTSRILVFRCWWLDIAPKKVKVTVDPYDNEHIHILDDEDKNAKLTAKEKEEGGKIETRYIKVVRQAHLIGGDMVLEWGLMPNQPRDIDNPSETRLPVKALIPDYVDYEPISKVWELKELQDFKNILMYKVQYELSTSGRKGFVFNQKFLPDGYEFDDVIYYSKAHGIIPADFDVEVMAPGERVIEPFDNSASQMIAAYVQLADKIKEEMDTVSGINPARQGASVSGREGLGVTQMQMVQSSTMTEHLFEMFYQYEARVFQGHVDMIKITWPHNKDKFAPIVGDLGVDVLQEDIGVDLNDYGIFVHVNPPIARDRERFEALVERSISTGFPVHIAMAVLMEKDLKRAMEKFKVEMEKHTQSERAFQMQMQQMQQQTQMQEQQMESQAKLANTNLEGEWSFREAMAKKVADADTFAKKDAASMKMTQFKEQMDILKKQMEAQQINE